MRIEITVRGVGAASLAGFDPITEVVLVGRSGDQCTLVGTLADQAAMRSLVNHLLDRHVDLLDLRVLERPE